MTKFLLLPALAATLFGAPALADDAESREIYVSPLELSTQAGAARVHARISAAALEACEAENRGGVAFKQSVRACTTETVERTIAQLDAPLLSAHHTRQQVRIGLASLTQ